MSRLVEQSSIRGRQQKGAYPPLALVPEDDQNVERHAEDGGDARELGDPKQRDAALIRRLSNRGARLRLLVLSDLLVGALVGHSIPLVGALLVIYSQRIVPLLLIGGGGHWGCVFSDWILRRILEIGLGALMGWSSW